MKKLDFAKENGLIPAVIQDFETNEVYMVGYMNEESLRLTVESGIVHFWSRSKKRIWKKGESSGNILKIKGIRQDCDDDALLISVELSGVAVCHTGNKSCFFKNTLEN